MRPTIEPLFTEKMVAHQKNAYQKTKKLDVILSPKFTNPEQTR